MKKTLTINLNGRVFTIDEDAYELLDKYIRNLRVYFSKEDGYSEIMADFEARISELFGEHIQRGYEVISIEQVENVIRQIGKPEDFGEEEDRKKDAGKKSASSQTTETNKTKKKFYRNPDDKIFGGVCSGISAYFDWDPVLVRLAAVLLTFAAVGWLIIVYLIVWIITPEAKTAEQKLQMSGQEVNLENIGKIVSEEKKNDIQQKEKRGCLGTLLDFIVAILKVCIIGIGLIIGLPLVFVLFIVIAVLIALIFKLGGGLAGLPFGLIDLGFITVEHPTLTVIASFLIIIIPVVSLIYIIIARLGKLKPIDKSIKWTCLVVWVLSLITLISSIHFNGENSDWSFNSWFSDEERNQTIRNTERLITQNEALPFFNELEMKNGLNADVRIHLITGDSVYMVLQGDSNIVKKTQWQINNKQLEIYSGNKHKNRPDRRIYIDIYTPVIHGVKIKSLGQVSIPDKLISENFFVELKGAGNFTADSLYTNNFHAELDGIGALTAKGIARYVQLNLKGCGEIETSDLMAEDVDAKLNGIGEINCNPSRKIEARLQGIGSINYVNEPETTINHTKGIGEIKKK